MLPRPVTIFSLTCFTLLCVACSSGGGVNPGATASGTTVVTTYYDAAQTQIEATGPVLTQGGRPTTIRHGVWTFHFPPAEGNGVQWTKTYANGTWDEAAPWTEYNADGSIRDDQTDP